MKKLMMVMVMGLALASTGFAREHVVVVGEHFGGHVVGGYVGPRVGVGFSYAPAPYVPVAPAYVYPQPYCPPVVGGVVVPGGFVRGHAFVDRDWHRDRSDWHGFRR